MFLEVAKLAKLLCIEAAAVAKSSARTCTEMSVLNVTASGVTATRRISSNSFSAWWRAPACRSGVVWAQSYQDSE